jgi:hypothetical protein
MPLVRFFRSIDCAQSTLTRRVSSGVWTPGPGAINASTEAHFPHPLLQPDVACSANANVNANVNALHHRQAAVVIPKPLLAWAHGHMGIDILFVHSLLLSWLRSHATLLDESKNRQGPQLGHWQVHYASSSALIVACWGL